MHFDCTDVFIEVNPRHVRFYAAMLGFTPLAEIRTNESVNAPSQLMWLNVSEVRRQIDEQGGRSEARSRSLYPYFFSRKEEEGIYGRLCRLAEQSAAFGSVRDHSLDTSIRGLRRGTS
jgi:hypothetical protein